MKKREDRTMSELYDRTQKIPRLKIEGNSCKEPLDQSVNESGGINENNKSPSRKRSISDDDNSCRKPGSGTCNVCNTPCTSCLHRMRVDTDTCSFVDTCSKHSHCENAETESNLRNPNKPKPFDIGIVNQEGQGENTSCITKYTKEKDIQKIDSHKESSSDNCKEESLEKKWFDSTDSLEKSDSNFRVSQKNSACNEKMFGGLENCDKRDFSEKDRMQVQKVVEVKNQETDNGLIDVKVCDICGDAGREELLATCSRCIDGAEHTYCMRVRLEKLPEGDWLCEECQLKDKAEKKKKRHTETSPLSTPLPEKENKSELMNSKNPFSHHKKLRISTDRAVYTSVPPRSPHKTFKEVISPGKSSNLARKNSMKTEIGSSKEVISPRKTSNLCRENSLKMETCSLKSSSGGQIMKKSHLLSRSYSLNHVSSLRGVETLRDVEKGQAEMLPPKGTMTKHLSFKNARMKPKVKSMTESIPTKQKISGFSLLKPTEEAKPFRRLIKSASLKEASSSRANTDSVKLTKPLSPTVQVNTPKLSEMSTEREKSSLEKKYFKGESRTNVLAQQPSSTVKKFEYKTEGSVPKKPECGTSYSHMEPALEDKKMSKPVLTKQHQANKNPRNMPTSNEIDKKLNRLKAAVKTVPPEARDGGNNRISDKPKVLLSRSGVSHNSKNQKAISINVEEKSRSTFSDKSRVEKASTNVLSLASSLEKEESVDLDVISPKVEVEKMKAPKDMPSWSSSLDKEKMVDIDVNTIAVGVEKIKAPKDMLSRARSLEKPMDSNGISANVKNVEVKPMDSNGPKDVISPKVGVEKMKAPKDMPSWSSSLDKDKMVDIDVNTIAVGVEKIKAPKDMLSRARSLEKPMDSNGISANVKNVEVKPMDSNGPKDVISPKVGVEKMKAPKDMPSWSSSLDKDKMVDIDVNTIAVGVEKIKAPKDMLSRARSLEKPMDSNGISANVKNGEVKPMDSNGPKDVISPKVGVEKMKAPKDMPSWSSSLDKDKMVDIDVNTRAVGVEKIKAPKDMLSRARSLEKPMDSNGISANVKNVEVKPMDSNGPKDVISPKVGVEKMKAPKDMPSWSSSLDKDKMVDIDVNTIAVGVEKIKAPKDMLSRARSLEKPMDSNGISANVKNGEVKPSMPIVYDSSLLGTPSEIMAIPEQDFVWQGGFQILQVRTQAWESFNGIQAHFSTHVSPKVLEVVAKFSDKLQLEEVPSGTVWPVQFQKTEPSEEHVALFFFARDLESYEASYSRLLQSLIGDNLALRGDIFGAELLIFPSDKLPKQSQRWNSLLYLWGIFRARKQVPSKTILNSAKPIGGPSGYFPTKIKEDVKPSKELTVGDNLPKPKVEDVADSLDLGPEPCKKPVEQNALKCLDSSTFCPDRETLNASHAAFTTQICAIKAEDVNEKKASLPILQRKMAENIADDNKTLALEKPTDAELKAGNKRAHLSDEISFEEMGLKKRKECDGFQIEAGHKSNTFLKKLTSPKIHPLSIDLEKPADACDVYSTEDGESTSLRNAGWPKTGSSAIKVISSDDNDAAENKMPNLKLALGNKNPSQKEVLPLPLFPLVRLKEEESDASPSLSLTIAPPGSEKGVKRPVMKIQQFLPEKPGVKEPLRLFGGYINP